MICTICKNKAKHTVSIEHVSKTFNAYLCSRHQKELETGDLTTGDIKIAMFSNLYK